jgi:hypothetical protein
MITSSGGLKEGTGKKFSRNLLLFFVVTQTRASGQLDPIGVLIRQVHQIPNIANQPELHIYQINYHTFILQWVKVRHSSLDKA